MGGAHWTPLGWGFGWRGRAQWIMLPGWPFRTPGLRKDLVGRESFGMKKKVRIIALILVL